MLRLADDDVQFGEELGNSEVTVRVILIFIRIINNIIINIIIIIIRIIKIVPHLEDQNIKMAIILPTGQWYAPSE